MIHFSIQTGLTKLSKKGFRSGSGIYFICSNKPQKKCPFDNAMEGVESFWSNAQMERVTIWMGLPPNQPGDTQSHPIPNPQSHIQLRLHFFLCWTIEPPLTGLTWLSLSLPQLYRLCCHRLCRHPCQHEENCQKDKTKIAISSTTSFWSKLSSSWHHLYSLLISIIVNMKWKCNTMKTPWSVFSRA